jgi:hypothetical protein
MEKNDDNTQISFPPPASTIRLCMDQGRIESIEVNSDCQTYQDLINQFKKGDRISKSRKFKIKFSEYGWYQDGDALLNLREVGIPVDVNTTQTYIHFVEFKHDKGIYILIEAARNVEWGLRYSAWSTSATTVALSFTEYAYMAKYVGVLCLVHLLMMLFVDYFKF